MMVQTCKLNFDILLLCGQTKNLYNQYSYLICKQIFVRARQMHCRFDCARLSHIWGANKAGHTKFPKHPRNIGAWKERTPRDGPAQTLSKYGSPD